MIVHAMLTDGGFVAGNTTTGLTFYAPPKSTYALRAKKMPYTTAENMMVGEKPSEARREYDRVNWGLIKGAPQSSWGFSDHDDI